MPRWLWWAPIALATVFFGALAFRYGWALVNLTETDVINRYAAQYLKEAGAEAKAADCVAIPSTASGIWLSVQCRRDGGAQFVYNVSRWGRLVTVPETSGPQT